MGDEYLGTVDTATLLRARLEIAGPTGEGHFDRFVDHLSAGRLDELLSVPAVSEWVEERIGNWASATHESLLRIDDDIEAIASWAGVDPPLTLVHLGSGLGDPHNGGRTVCRADFSYDTREGTSTLCIAYKPRSLRAEASFSTFVSAVCAAADVEPPRLPAVLDRGGTHGYTEWIERADVPPEQTSPFLRRLGRLLAILYLCRAEDCHYENFICDGRSLVPVDLEALSVPSQLHPSAAALAGHQLVAESVLRTGVLPQWSRIEDGRSIDTSLLGMLCTDAGEVESEDWVDPNTDAMRWGVTTARLPLPDCTAGPSVTVETLREATPDLAGGFREILSPLVDPARRRAVLDALSSLGSFPVRRVHRPTRVYSLLLREASGPAEMADRTRREDVFARLGTLPLTEEWYLDTDAVLTSELEQLRRGDVPYFSEATEPAASSPDGWRRRLTEITPTSIDFNVNVIFGAMLARFPASEGAVETVRRDPPPRISQSSLSALVGLRTLPETEHLEPESPDWSLYDGLWGPALVRDSDDPEVASLLGRALETGRLDGWVRDAGPGLAGAGGLLRVLARMATPSDFAAVARRLLLRFDDAAMASHDNPELLYGLAGILRPLTELASADSVLEDRHSVLARDVADAVACRILDLQDRRTGGWSVPGLPRQLCGFSHGAAGIAAALATATTRTREVDEAIHGALDFESRHFDVDSGNWRDLRPGVDDAPLSSNAWCHGAAGIVLSRALIIDHRPTSRSVVSRALADVDLGMARVTDGERSTLDTLCCGAAGRSVTASLTADLLDSAGHGAGRSSRLRAAASVQMSYATSHRTPRCSVRPDPDEVAPFLLGFMNGTTGVVVARDHGVDDLIW